MVCVANPICTSGGPTLIFCESVCRVNKTLSFFQWFAFILQVHLLKAFFCQMPEWHSFIV